MEYHNIHSTLNNGERVTSTYAEVYFNDTNCELQAHSISNNQKVNQINRNNKKEWVSPSDLLIDVVASKPPFTSKITRSKTHKGILTIGNSVLQKERDNFLNSLTTILEDNDAAWAHILINEKQGMVEKVKAIFQNIFKYKSEIMKQEVSNFYEQSLQELEEHLRSEVHTVIESTRANIVSYLNNEIAQKLRNERKILVNVLAKKYTTEEQNMKKYYKTLLDNELHRNNTLINKALRERNDMVKAFYKQIESERLTSTMYIMSLERKKCQIKKMFLEKFQSAEITEKLQQIKRNEDEMEILNEKDVRIAAINKEWEKKIKKVLQIFLKFTSFSLKLLPEQTSFLLDLEKMVVLQLNEIQKTPNIISTVLFEENEELNIFEFPSQKLDTIMCEKGPFVLLGDTVAESTLPHYGSRETLPSDVNLPYFRLNRNIFYAECHGYEDIKKIIDSRICKCRITPEPISVNSSSMETKLTDQTSKTQSGPKESAPNPIISSTESLLVDDYVRLHECPVRKCCDWMKMNTFPFLISYLDYNEENFKRVTSILGEIPEHDSPPVLINVKDVLNNELPFAKTKELYHTMGTQYSREEDLSLTEVECFCVGKTLPKQVESHYMLKSTSSEVLHEIMLKRKISLQRLIDNNPSVLKIFTEECFDYKL